MVEKGGRANAKARRHTADSPLGNVLDTRPAAERETPPAHLGGTSTRGPTWPCAWFSCQCPWPAGWRTAKLTSGAAGTPDESARTVHGTVTAFFENACTAAMSAAAGGGGGEGKGEEKVEEGGWGEQASSLSVVTSSNECGRSFERGAGAPVPFFPAGVCAQLWRPDWLE